MTSTRNEAPALVPDPARALGASFYERPVVDVARDLLGCLLVSQHDGITTAGLIVETEAYAGPDDPASHAAFRRNGTVTAMWGPPGRAYVYLAYGVYPCFNVVTGPEGEAAAVLIRAIAPVAGIEHMAVRRGGADGPRLASGPGRLAVALGITLADNGRALDGPPLWIQPGAPPDCIAAGPRIGVRRGDQRPWRFGIAGHPLLSRPFPP
ncbi:DNA-3-methyladenine glycosylase [Sphaerobacter thermophilus]|uniref:DNA-3-methyladenine glycosylase n=1 Tax=Sphaerobacter thermophilus TaxID=2057 RepID=UPI000DB74C23|nr:MAG: DNA-3-methyladenine glycosylase [Sphaerobacter thermophilus]